MTERLDDRTVLVTGANGGLGTEFVTQLLERGARRVYAAARTPRDWADSRVVPIALDITDPRSIADAASRAADVDLLINNAGIAPADDTSVAQGGDEALRRVFETNFFGSVAVMRAFVPVLAANGGGALLNVVSAAAWTPVPTAYAASKAALWSAANGLRFEIGAQGTTVTNLLMGMVDTPMSERWDVPKVTPQSVVTQALDGAIAGAHEVLADDVTRQAKVLLGRPSEEMAAAAAAMLGDFAAAQ